MKTNNDSQQKKRKQVRILIERLVMRFRKYVSKKLFSYAMKMWPENPELIKYINNVMLDVAITGMSVTKIDYTNIDPTEIWKDISA